jgi:hypothetical protein
MKRVTFLLWLLVFTAAHAELTVKPPKLPGLLSSGISSTDLFLIWDTSSDTMKKITASQLDTRWTGGGGGGGASAWGDITGTLSAQTDLQAALNAKQNSISTGALSSGTTGLTVTNGSGAVIGSGTSISIQTATNSVPGLLSAADHTAYAASSALTTAATNSNTNSAIVKRDSSGNFSATTITAALSGNASTATALAANPAACGAGSYVTDIAADGTLTCSNPFTGMAESYTGMIETVADKTYVVDHYAAYAKQVVNIRAKCTSGSVTVALKIAGTNITSCSAISVTSSSATTTCDTGSSNNLGANGELTLVTSSNSSCTDFVWAIKTTRD